MALTFHYSIRALLFLIVLVQLALCRSAETESEPTGASLEDSEAGEGASRLGHMAPYRPYPTDATPGVDSTLTRECMDRIKECRENCDSWSSGLLLSGSGSSPAFGIATEKSETCKARCGTELRCSGRP